MTTIAKSCAVVNPSRIETQRHPTLADVAAAAGVSASTASRALRESPVVGEGTRQRVFEAARALGFEPNRIARSLRTRSSFSIGVVVPDVATVFWAAALKGAQDVLERAGYLVLVMSSEREPKREAAALRTLIAHRVDGILLATSGGYDQPPAVPVVFFDRLDPAAGTRGVAPANRDGIGLLFDHLRGHRHTRIGFVGGHPGSSSADERLAAFEAEVTAAGLPLRAGYVRHGDAAWSEASGEQAGAELAELAERPTAIIAASDALAVGALRALRGAGLRVPEDVALVSFDDPVFADLLDPPVTALSRHDREVGELAAAMLLEVLTGNPEPGEVRVPLELIVRRSCGCDGRG